MIIRSYDISTGEWTEREEPDATYPEAEVMPEPSPSLKDQVAELQEQLAAAKILLGIE